ncbi:alpha/beta fold hydrolase [Sorangium cellulosum]|uniref:alpha/beta fold hydrolase n=1 Tax=Sorangium cellulosum TaxID=56 RepID=UPI000A4FF078|nr:alpha/beta fold hydrolase [Sorangium cellulosum]
MFVTETGSGRPAVLLPSMLISGMSYGPTVEALRRRARVIVIELPGSGRGGRLRAPWTLEQYARCIAEALQALQLEGVTLIGHSMSGAAALVAGALYPERLSGLVLVDSVGVNPPRSLLALVLGRMADMRIEPRFAVRVVPAFLYNLLVHTRSALRFVRLAAEADLSGYAARLRVRALLAWGARDFTVPLGSALALQRLIPGATLVVSSKGSHDWIVERPAEFADAVARFMERGG